MAKKRSPEDKATILTVLKANGNNANKTAKELDVPERTVNHYKNGERGAKDPKVLELIPDAQQKCKDMGWTLIHNLMNRLFQITDEATDIQKVTTSIGTMIDKMQLLEGKPSVISETNSATSYQATMDLEREKRRLSKIGA